MEIPGKLEFRKLEDSDLPCLEKFCNTCKDLGYENNSNFKAIKLDQMKMPYGQYFIGYDHEKKIIWNLAGVHQLPEINHNGWRCLFRGLQLPGYSMINTLSKNLFKSCYQISYILPMQMQFIKNKYSDAKFYMTSNNKKNEKYSGKSQRLDSIIMPSMERYGSFKRIYDDIELFYTRQSVWEINEDIYYLRRKEFIGDDLISVNRF